MAALAPQMYAEAGPFEVGLQAPPPDEGPRPGLAEWSSFEPGGFARIGIGSGEPHEPAPETAWGAGGIEVNETGTLAGDSFSVTVPDQTRSFVTGGQGPGGGWRDRIGRGNGRGDVTVDIHVGHE